MTTLRVGSTGSVHGRLPRGWRIAACFDEETGFVHVSSPDMDRFSVNVDTSKLHEYSTVHEPTADLLEDACLEAKYDADTCVQLYSASTPHKCPSFGLKCA
jgi:hypothetical protein